MNQNGLAGNPHADISQREVMDHDSALINVTLALAYEQRTANLIAYEQGQWAAMQDNSLDPTGVELWKEAAGQISQRLGLNKGN